MLAKRFLYRVAAFLFAYFNCPTEGKAKGKPVFYPLAEFSFNIIN
jgi:hypothetical protein